MSSKVRNLPTQTVNSSLLALLPKMKKSRVLLVGDLVADHYIHGKTSRISREAPVLILKFQNEYVVPGQAGNTACNIAALGGTVTAIGVLGTDRMGKQLKKAMQERGVSTKQMIELRDFPTLTKTRILAGGHHTCRQQVIRIDDDERSMMNGEVEDRIVSVLRNAGSFDAVVVSDYGYGLVSDKVWECAMDLKKKRNMPVILDSRYRLLSLKGATLITPNEGEAVECCGTSPDNDYDIEKIGSQLLRKSEADSVLVTRGNEGMVLFQRAQRPFHIPIFGTDEVTDVTGAGDTVVAAAALALGGGATLQQAAEIANIAAGIVVMKVGTATVSLQELKTALETGLVP